MKFGARSAWFFRNQIPFQKPFTTIVRHDNRKLLLNYSENLNNNTTIFGGRTLYYGLGRGCVNYTSRALLFSGVVNVNAFLPITSPVLLNAEMFIRQMGIYTSPYIINK